MRSVIITIALLSTFAACGENEKNAPLPESNLETRNAALREVKSKLVMLEQASVDQAVSLLSHKDHRVRRAALKRVGSLGQAPPAVVNALLKGLADKNDDVRIEAAIALGTVNSEAAVKPLINALIDPNSKVRLWAYKALRKLGARAVPEMIRHISDQKSEEKPGSFTDATNKKHSLEDIISESLAEMGKDAVPYLIDAIKRQKGKTARNSVVLLGKIGKDASEGVYVLLEILNSSTDIELKKNAIIAIGEIGDVDPEVVPTLMSISEESNAALSQEARKALKKLEEKS